MADDDSTRESPYDTCQEDVEDNDESTATATPAAAPVTVFAPPSSLDQDDFLSSTYKKAVEYCRPLVTSSSSTTSDDHHADDDDLTTTKGWIPQPVDNLFESKRNLEANMRELDDGGKLCRLDCDFPEYTVKQVDGDGGAGGGAGGGGIIECHAVATKYYCPIPYFKPELRELRLCITPPPPPQQQQQQQEGHKEEEEEEEEEEKEKHLIIAS
ncbi:hypothetical protein FOZ61_001005, partial [Perkinsus olseni]